MMKAEDLINSPQYNWRTAAIGLAKLCAILAAAIIIILGVLIFALSMAHDPNYEMKAWCNKYHPELSYNDCQDEAGV